MRELPQKSLPIINEIVEALASIRLSSYEFNIIMAVIRKTYGWGKKDDWISLTQLRELTKIPTQHCCRTIKKLLSKNIIIKNAQTVGINKKTTQWLPKQPLPKQVLPKQVTGTTQTGNQPLPKQVDTKDTTTKDTIQKTTTNVVTTEVVDRRKPEINKMLEALKLKIGISAFVDSRIERNMAKNCNGLLQKIGKDEFVRRLDIILEDDFKHKNCNSIRYVYNQIKGFIEQKNDSKVGFIS